MLYATVPFLRGSGGHACILGVYLGNFLCDTHVVGNLTAAVTQCGQKGTEGMSAGMGSEIECQSLVGCNMLQDTVGGGL